MSVRSVLRAEAMQRSGGRCEFPSCTLSDGLEMAHLLGTQAGGSKYRDVLENVAMLCGPSGFDHHGWLDGRTLSGRRFDNEAVLRAALGREWKDRR